MKKSKLGNNLTTLRKEAGLTQKELADKIGVDHTVVSNWERGINKYGIEMLRPLCEALKVSVNDLLGIYTDYPLNPKEKQFIKMFRGLEESERKLIINIGEALLKNQKSNLIDLDPGASELLEMYYNLPGDVKENLLGIVKALGSK